MRRILTPSLLGLALAFHLACGGASSSPAVQAPPASSPTATPATTLVYTDPAGTGWRLVRNNGSLPGRLILTLVGPDGARARGVGFTLRTDGAMVQWGSFGMTRMLDHQVFQLDAWDHPISFFRDQPLLTTFQFSAGEAQGGIFQKDPRYPSVYVDRPILSLVLELNPSATIPSGTVIPLAVPKAGVLPSDLASATGLQPVVVSVGTLQAL